MYEAVDEMLSAAGMSNYEVSNWSLPGRECRHNRVYWSQGDYLGFGSAAHSHRAGRRWWNVRTPDRYIERVTAGRSAESASETLDGEARRIEALQLALRTIDGVPRESFTEADRQMMSELLEDDGTRVRLTRRGRLLANEVALRLR
jgi:oxygen-independent coproporphyrinogen-3 oxidase